MFAEKQRIYDLSLLITLCFIGCIFILYQYLILGHPFMSQGALSDLLRANLPTYTHLYDALASGIHFWSWNMGIGTSMFSHADVYFDPFVYISFLRGRDNIAYMMGWSFALKLIFEAISIFFYLHFFKINRYAIIIVSLLYAFSGYSLITGSNLALGTIMVYAPMVLLGIEQYLYSKKKIVLMTFIFLIAICSYYYLYVIGIIVLMYSLIRISMKGKSFRALYSIVLLCVIPVIFALPVILPQLELILSSVRSDTKDIAWGLYLLIPDYQVLFTLISRSFDPSAVGNYLTGYYGSNYNGADYFQNECFVSCICAPLLCLYVLKNKDKRKLTLTTILLVLLFSCIPLTSFVFNAFTTINYRWMFILHILLCTGCAASLGDLLSGKYSDKDIFYAVEVSITILIISVYMSIRLNDSQTVLSIVWNNWKVYAMIVFAYFMLFLCGLLFFKSDFRGRTLVSLNKNKIVASILCLIVLTTTIVAYLPWYGTSDSVCHFEDSNYGYDDASAEVISNLVASDTSFYRIHKDFDSVYDNLGIPSDNDALVQKYYGLKNYNSLDNSNYVRFLQTMGVYVACNPDIESLRAANIQPSDLTGATLNYINGIDDRYELYTYLGVKYYLSKSSSENEIPPQFSYLYSSKGIDVYINENCMNLGFVNNNYMYYSDFLKLSYEGRVSTLLTTTILPDDQVLPTSSIGTVKLISFTEDNLVFTSDNTNYQYVCFSIPYDSNWKVFVDGNMVDPTKVNVGLLGVSIGPGTHTIELKYVPEKMVLGGLIAIVFATACALYAINKKYQIIKDKP